MICDHYSYDILSTLEWKAKERSNGDFIKALSGVHFQSSKENFIPSAWHLSFHAKILGFMHNFKSLANVLAILFWEDVQDFSWISWQDEREVS